MEYKNKNHAYIDTAESRDAFDSRIRSGKKESDYEKQKKFSAALEKENSTKEQKKSEYIKATEERKQQEKRLKMYQSFLEDDVATYRATGDAAALERINKTKTTLGKVESSFLKAAERNKTAATEYDAAIGRFNRVLGKFQTARAAWEGSARTDRASIQGELERLKQERKEKQKQYTESAEIVRAYERALPKGQKIGEWANIAGARKGTRNLSMENSRDIAAHRYLLKESLGKEVRDLDARIEELEAELRFSYVAPYINKGDFEAGSAYKSTKNGKKVITQPVYTTINPGDPNFGTIKVGERIIESGFQDLLYDYINKDPDAVNVQRMGDGGVVSYHGVDKSFLETMTGDEIAIFNYIYRESPEKAYGFIKTLEGDLQLRETIKKREEWKKYGKENKIIASVGDVLLAGEKAKTGAMNALNYIGTGEIDENAGYNDLIRASGAIREGVSQDMGKVGTFIYNTSMSLADNVARLALSGGNSGVAQSIMFGGVFADTVVSAKDRGLSDKQAFALGVATAGIEALTEKMPLDAILDGKTLKESAKRYILKGAISEAGEELTSNALSTWADVIISKDKSEWKQSIAAYEAQGFGAKEAFGRAFRDQALSAGVDSLAGLFSGAAMSGGVAVINKAAETVQKRRNDRAEVAASKLAMMKEAEAERERRATMPGVETMPGAEQKAEGTQSETFADEAGKPEVILPTAETAENGTTLPMAKDFIKDAQNENVTVNTENVLPTFEEQKAQAERAERAKKAETETERTGILLGVKEEVIQDATRASKALGIGVVFYRNRGGKVTKDKGYYNHKDGKIYLNADIEDPLSFVFGHEMVHHIQLTDGYIKFYETVLRKIQKDGGDLAAMRKEIYDRYARNGVQLNSIAKIDQELVAEYAHEHLFKDVEKITSVVNADKESGRKILGFFDNVLAKLGNTDARERVFIENARKIYAGALGEMSGERRTAEHREEARAAQETTKQEYSREELSEEEYDERMDILDAERSMAGESMLYDDGRQYAIEKEKGVAKEGKTWYDIKRNNKNDVTSDVETDIGDAICAIPRQDIVYAGMFAHLNGDPEFKRLYNAAKAGSYEAAEELVGKYISEEYLKTFTSKYQDVYIVPIIGGDGVSKNILPQYIAKYIADATGNVYYNGINKLTKTGFAESKASAAKRFSVQIEFSFKNGNRTEVGEKRFVIFDDNISTGKTATALRDFIEENGGTVLGYASLTKGRDSTDNMAITPEQYADLKERYGEDFKHVSRIVERLTKRQAETLQNNPALIWDAVDGRRIERTGRIEGGGRQRIREEGKTVGVSSQGRIDSKRDSQTEERHIVDDAQNAEERQYAIEKDGERGNAETSSENTRADNLPKKAQAALRQTENRLSERIGEILGVPKQAQREFLKNIIREISEGYLQSGTVDRTKADALFEEAYKQGVVIDAEYFEQYKHVRDHLRNTKITIAEEDRSSIADFNAFRKSTLGKLRIVNEGGIPVDVVYMELEEMAPELFPTEITHPGDQLQHMYEIADGIRVSEQTLEEAYGEEADTFKEMARDEFHEALNGAVSDFKRVKRYSEDRERMAAEKKAEEDSRLKSTEDVKEAYKNLMTARRNVEKIKRNALLTEEDEMLVGQLLRGEISPMSLDPETDNVKDILAVYNAKKKYEEYAKQLRAWNDARKRAPLEKAKKFLEGKNVHNWGDKKILGGFRYSIETMERIFRDIMGEDAEAMKAEYITPVHKAQAEAIKLKNEMRDRVRALGLSRKAADGNLVSEAHAVQLLGEAEDNIAVLKAMPKGKKRDGKTLSEWEGTVAKLWAENPKLDEVKIRKAVQEFRDIYDFLFEQMNEVRVRNGYEPVNYRRGYFPHFQPGDEGVLAQFGRILGIDTSVSALPTTINGMTHIFRPGIQWLGNAQERLGFNTVYDAVEGFDKYIEGVADVIYQTDNIQKLRALAKEIRYAASDEGIRKQVDAVEKREDLSREEKDALNAKLFEEGKFSLGNFVVELDEYTNLLANKKSREDREMERKLGREFYNVARRINSNVAANMTALNIPSWLTNFIPLTQAWGLTDTRHLLRGMRDTLKNVKEEDDIVARSVFLTTRRDSDPIVQMWEQGEEAKTWFGKMGRGYQAAVDKLSGGMELIDNFTSEAIVRAKYYQNLKEGMSEQAAMEDADAFAAGVMADRSKGAMPTAFYQTNPMKKLFTQFQIEVNNQYRYVFKDVPYALKNKGVMALAMALTKIVVGAFLYNELYELLFGRRAATDILGILNDTAGDFTGYNLPSLLDIARGEADFKEEDPSAWKGVSNLVKNVGEEMPFVGGVVFGGGRVPLSSALPDAQNLGKAIFNGDWSGKKRFATFGKEILKPVYYGVLPGGGGQIKKVVEGADAVIRGGSYTTDTEGKDVLQYPVYNDGWDMPVTAARAMLFGKSTLPTAKDWVDGGFKSLSAKDTEAYQAMLETGAKGEDAFAAVQAVRKAEKSNDKRDAIRISGLSDEAKKVLYRTKISDTRDDEIAELERKGINFDDFLRIHNEYTTINTQYEGEGAASKKAMAFSRWVNSQPWTKTQKDAVRDAFAYFSQIPAETGKYDAFMDAGLTDEKAAKVAEALRALKPEKGKDKVSDLQRYRTVATAALTDKEKMAALSTMMGESEYKKLDIGSRHGVTPIMYVTFKEKLLEYDEDANGTFKQEEVTKAIRAMTGSGINLPKHDGSSFNLTNKQRAALWQMANSSWKPNKNPFDTSVGTQVYNALKNKN